MKIALVGATGKSGEKILNEAITRGLDITAVVRNATKLTQEVNVIEKDLFALTAEDFAGFDIVINAFGVPVGQEELQITSGRHLISLLEGTATRLIVVGGAGSLFVNEEKTIRCYETSEFPEFLIPMATSQFNNLKNLQASSITWTFLSPSIEFDPEGARSGSYTLGQENLLFNSQGESYISYADLAIAIIDEAIAAKHANKHFTVVAERV